eukprot:jgi/Mesen1/7446/ME000389S06789
MSALLRSCSSGTAAQLVTFLSQNDSRPSSPSAVAVTRSVQGDRPNSAGIRQLNASRTLGSCSKLRGFKALTCSPLQQKRTRGAAPVVHAVLETASAGAPEATAKEGGAEVADVKHEQLHVYDGLSLAVQTTKLKSGGYRLSLSLPTPGMTLHWGVNDWNLPDRSIWPDGSVQASDQAIQTPFTQGPSGQYEENEDKWHNNGSNFSVVMREPDLSNIVNKTASAAAPKAAAEKEGGAEVADVKHEQLHVYDGLSLAVQTLHWGVNDWNLPDRSIWPDGSVQASDQAIQTPFTQGPSGQYEVNVSVAADAAPARLVFVLKDNEDKWYNNGSNFSVVMREPGLSDIVNKVVTAESTYSNWSLLGRFGMAVEVLNGAEEAGPDGMAFVFTWLRFSANRQLAWYRNNNYQSKDIAHIQKVLASSMAEKIKRGKDPVVRRFARLAMSTLPRGGGDSEQIRMGILHIMREHGIREGHRPGIEEKFLEQWHQKLHTNTSPEDIAICEAYLDYLHTANMDSFYHTLWEKGRVTKEWLHSMDHPLTATPLHLPHLIPAFQHFLWVLKTVHSGADLDVMVEMSKGFLDDGLKGMLYEILNNRGAWWVPGKVVETRRALESVWRSEWASRDIVLLDIALDNFFGLCVGRVDKSGLSGDDLCELISLVLSNAVIGEESLELASCLHYWDKVKSQPRWTEEWAQLAVAAADSISLSLESHMDEVVRRVQPHAEHLGHACGIDQSYITNFGEEVVRGQSLFNLSQLLLKLTPMLRSAAGLGPWQIVSQVEARGEVVVIASLADIQGKSYASPTIVIANEVGGMEDIPENVTGVLSLSATDVLSHVAIRARNSNVLLATCFEPAQLDALKALAGKVVETAVDGASNVTLRELPNAAAAASGAGKAAASPAPSVTLEPILETKEWAIGESKFKKGLVGGKSGSIAKLRASLPSTTGVPASVTLPFGTFERVLAASENASVAAEVDSLISNLAKCTSTSSGMPAELAQLRKTVSDKLVAPAEVRAAVTQQAETAGLVSKGLWESNAKWTKVWHAICQVWASKWTDRAWLSRRAQSVAEDSLKMACLLQQVVGARYAFVLHTVHPVTKDRNTMLVEAVLGLGEVLVGNYPGRAFSFTVPKGASSSSSGGGAVQSLPSKRLALYAIDGSLIARSDSNGEDLETFAGAGLYDSILVEPATVKHNEYVEEPLLWDADLGLEVEAACNGVPQDIEGVYADGKFTVVQARPQVL